MVLVLVAGYGWWLAHHGTISDAGRATIAKLVNALIPVFLFYSVTSKFGREQMIELLEMAFLPFITIGLNWAISEAMIRVEKGARRRIRCELFGRNSALRGRADDNRAVRRSRHSLPARLLLCQLLFHLVGRPLPHSNGRGSPQRRRASEVLFTQKRQGHLRAARRCVPARHRFRAHLHTHPELSHGNL